MSERTAPDEDSERRCRHRRIRFPALAARMLDRERLLHLRHVRPHPPHPVSRGSRSAQHPHSNSSLSTSKDEGRQVLEHRPSLLLASLACSFLCWWASRVWKLQGALGICYALQSSAFTTEIASPNIQDAAQELSSRLRRYNPSDRPGRFLQSINAGWPLLRFQCISLFSAPQHREECMDLSL